jgi:glutathione S-transferase
MLNMPNQMTLYGNPESGHAYKVKLFLDVAEIPYTYQLVDIFVPRQERPEPFRKLSLAKFGEVPLLVHDGISYAQSDAILLHLAQHTGRFGGSSPQTMSLVREWLFWEANKLGLSLPHLRLARNYFPDDFPAGAVSWLQTRYDADIAHFDSALADGRPFITGDELTIADFSLCGYLFFANQAHVKVPRYVNDWLCRMQALPSWKPPFALLAPDIHYQTFGIIKDHFEPAPQVGS